MTVKTAHTLEPGSFELEIDNVIFEGVTFDKLTSESSLPLLRKKKSGVGEGIIILLLSSCVSVWWSEVAF